MKTLLLMRHGKSSWKQPDLDDHERPLAKRGLRDSRRMGEMMLERELIPQTILCSSAVRTLETARGFCQVSSTVVPILAMDSLYLAEADVYFAELRALPNTLERVMLIGHNPGLESLLQILAERAESLPTAVVAYLVLPIDSWADLSSKTKGNLVEIWRPKEIRWADEDKEEKKKTKKKKKDK
jgi:phosphohistidine phosphatase